jgi:hypothetical protein
MPVCEKCQTPYDEWQHFCLHCGHYVRAEPPPSRRCPQCGRQAALEQNFCPECAAPLKEETAAPPAPLPPPSRKWLVRGLATVLLGLGVLLTLYLSRWPWLAPAPRVESQNRLLNVAEDPAIKGGAQANGPGTTGSRMRVEVEGVLNQIKEANLTKDILLYMDTLSAVYPQLDKKRQEISKTWEKYDFKEMTFTVNKIRDLGNGNVVAEVNWRTWTENPATKELRTDDVHYRVWFAIELEQWKIKQIEELQP